MKIFTFLSIVVGFFIMSIEFNYGANLAIRKSGPSNANPGDLVTYTITYSNTVSTLEDNVVITDYLPDAANCTYHSSFPSGVYNSVFNTLTWNSTQIAGLANLDAGSGENTIQVTVQMGKTGTGVNQSGEGYYLNASSVTLSCYSDIKSDQTTTPILSNTVPTVVSYDCSFKVSQPSAGIKSATGSTLTYLVAITNTGNIYQKYSLNSTLFSGQHLNQSIQDLSGGTISVTPFVAPGSTYLFHYVLTTPTGTNPNQFTETKITATPNICGDPHDAIYKTFIYGGSYSNYELLSVYKIDTSDPVQSGSQLTYQIVISNVGSPLANVRLTETYPPNTSFVSATSSTTSVTTGNNIWNFATLPSGNTIINVTLDVANGLPNGSILSNTVEVSSNGIVYDTYTETTTVASAPDLSITKTASVVNSIAGPGSIVNYTLTYTNNGNYEATGVVIKDNYDETYMNVGSIGTGINAGGEITWNIPGSLIPGESGSINYSMSIKNNALLFVNGSTNIINNALISSNLTDSNISDNTATATVNVFVLPDLKIEKTADPSIGHVNQPITYTLSVSNIGKLDHTGSTYTVVDYLPAGTTYLSSTPSGGIYSSGTLS
ncbi:MAG TPA: DUF11 domain-containing protein, partial [Prolixibacteraceae bacterium]|nr:DUF11 domain-containing protein [Prolixibacteraceae bacterium]